MREMKDSGIEWIGEIPKHWSLTKIGMLYTLRNTKVSDKEYQPLSVTKMGVLPQLETVAKTNAHDDRKLVKKGDFAINSRSDRRGSCGISSYDGSVSLINTVLTPRERMHPGYYNWLFHTIQFSDEFYKNGHGIVDDLWTTNWQDMKKIVLPIPMYNEQQVVSDYLDQKCSEIDAISSDIQKQISVLEDYKKSVITEAVTKGLNPDVEMKDSGVEWIGEIPEKCKISKLKYVATLSPKCEKFQNLKGNYELTFTPMESIKNAYFINESKHITELANSLTRYQEGDIALAKVTPCFENGNICIMENLVNKVGMGSSELFIIRSKNIVVKRYLLYWLQNIKFINEACKTMTGIGGLKRVSSVFLNNSEVPVFDKQTQQDIVKYLDQKYSEIDSLISDKKKQLEILVDYKKSLIYEYVAGKKEVPES